jgi:hypothetical protein
MDEYRNRNNLVVGGMLVAVGVLFFVALFFQQSLDMLDWGNLWPLTIVAVGALFFVGMVIGGRSTSGLAIPGSIISTVGLILWAQNAFNIFETWSYAWALIIVAVGVGQVIMGYWADMPGARTAGFATMRVGAVLFLVFGAMMEIIFSLTGVSNRQMSIIFPLGLLVLGLVLLITRLLRIFRPQPEGIKAAHPERDLNLFWPVIFMGLGLIWTLSSLGLFPQIQVMAMLNLWPLLLVAIGLQVMFGRRSPLVGGLIALLMVAALFAFVAFATPQMLSARLPFLYTGQVSVAGPRQVITGQGDFVTEERQVGGFTRIELLGAGTLEVVQGDTEGLSINAQQNLLPYIESRVVGSRLIIGPKQGYELKPTGTILYRLTVKNLNGLTLNGSGEINIAALQTGNLNLDINGSGSISLADLQAGDLNLNINGSGRVTAAGAVERLEVDINGVGNFNGENLQAQKASTGISGSGQLVVWVIKTLDVNISGSGSVGYYGSPEVQVDGHGTVNSLGSK